MKGPRLPLRVSLSLCVALFCLALSIALGSGALAAADGLLGLTYQELYARLGQPAAVFFRDRGQVLPPNEWGEPSTPGLTRQLGSDEYRFTREGMPVLYRITYAPDHRASRWEPAWRVTEYQVVFGEPVPLRQVPRLVPELAFLSTSSAKFTYAKLPLRSYAQDVVVHAYLPGDSLGAAAWQVKRPAEALSVLLYGQWQGSEVDAINADLRVTGVVVGIGAPEPQEVPIPNPLS